MKINEAITMTQPQASAAREEHLKFMGIPICGSLDLFVDALVGKGFKVSKWSQNSVCLYGNYGGYRGHFFKGAQARACVSDLGEVCRIEVSFRSQIPEVYRKYLLLKAYLRDRYGDPEMAHFVEDRHTMSHCHFSVFNLEAGVIMLSLEYGMPWLNGCSEPIVRIEYTDKAGYFEPTAAED